MNACKSAGRGFSLTSIQGWAQKFLECGAAAFIGTMWDLNANIALKFSQSFYTNIALGMTLGNAVKEARKSCKHNCSVECGPNCNIKEDPSWLSYQLYGHPYQTIDLVNKGAKSGT